MTLIKKENKFRESWCGKNPALYSTTGSVGFILILTLVILFGVFLRVYLLAGQILIDDEWHGMYYPAAVNSLSYLFTHFSLPGATCIPQNVYNYILLKTTGWSEILIRLPSIVCGIAALVIFPVLVRKVFSKRITVIFTLLLAISPFLVFYSRVARPYSTVTMLGFISIWALYLWITKGNKKYGVYYIISGILAIYFHLFAVIGVLVPLGCAFATELQNMAKNNKKKTPQAIPKLTAMIIAITVIIVTSAILVVPGIITSRISTLLTKDNITLISLIGFASTLSGTASPLLMILFYALLIFGLITLVKKIPLLGGIFISTAVFYFVALYLSKPESISAPIVISRYLIVLFPLAFVAVALGMDTILQELESVMPVIKFRYGVFVVNAVAVGFLIIYFMAGPLLQTYSPPNNFTNHSAFQESYKPLIWEQSYTANIKKQYFTVQKKDMPAFYDQLIKSSADTIIEYPMSFVNQFNLYYYYQHFHKKRVIAGYFARVDLSRNQYMIWVDEALSIRGDVAKYRFRNMVNMEDIEAIKHSGAQYIILHKNLLPGEWTPHNFVYPLQDYVSIVSFLSQTYIKSFGQPVFQDKNVTVFATSVTENKVRHGLTLLVSDTDEVADMEVLISEGM